jgi:hypothetical protein
MHRLLSWLTRKSALSIFIALWFAVLLAWATTWVMPMWITRTLKAAVDFAALIGYPLVVILGLPTQSTSRAIRVVSFASLLVAAVCSGASGFTGDTIVFPDGNAASIVGAVVVLLIFAPFFIATHVIGNARRALGQYKPLDFLWTWLELYAFALGGVFFVHRAVASIVNAAGAAPSNYRLERP